MEDILYVKAEQNVAVKKKDLQIKDVATLYSSNTAMVQKLEKEPFYTLPGDSKILTMFTVTKIYEAVHKVYPKIQIENLGETDFIVEYEPQKKEKKWLECLKTIVVAAIVLIGSAYTFLLSPGLPISSTSDLYFTVTLLSPDCMASKPDKF